MSVSSRLRVARLALVLVLIVAGLAVLARPAGADSATPAVTASGSQLLLQGQPWWPAGVDAYELATDWSVNAGCGAEVDLDSFFGSLPPQSLVRFDAYQALAINKNTGTLDLAPITAVFTAAAKYHDYVIPVLTGQDGGCDNGVYKQESWYETGWTQTLGAPANIESFQDWMTTAVEAWSGESSLAGWELVGEPEDPVCGDSSCDWQTNTCPSDAATVLRSFMDTAGAQVKALDPEHLIFGGFEGGGQCGTGYTDYQYVAASPYIDVLEYHDYGADGVPLPGDQWNGLAERISQAQALAKPLLVAEVGENAGDGVDGCVGFDQRSSDVQTKLTGQQAAGTAGLLVWDWVPDPRTDQCTEDVGPTDPMLGMLAQYNTVDGVSTADQGS